MIIDELKATTVYRSGVTANRWDYGTKVVRLAVRRDDTLALNFSVSSAGGGETELDVRIGIEDFAALLRGMAQADQKAALAAMAEEVAHQVRVLD